MKKIVFFTILCAGSFAFGQGGGVPVYSNAVGISDAASASLTGNRGDWSKIEGVFYQFDDIRLSKAGIDGSNYLFDEWENDGVIIAGQKKYKTTNINYNVGMQRFESKLEGNSLFVYDLHSLSKLYVNGKQFKSLYDNNQNANVIYEVLYDDENMSLLKNYDIKVVQGSPNPMLNRKTTKIQKRESYYVQTNGVLKALKLKKKDVLNMVGNKKSDVEQYAKKNKLSFKKDDDVVRILKYASIK